MTPQASGKNGTHDFVNEEVFGVHTLRVIQIEIIVEVDFVGCSVVSRHDFDWRRG